MALIPGWGKSPKEGHGNPLQYSCLGSHMTRRAIDWGCYSPWGHESWTQLSDSTTTNGSPRAHCIPRLHPAHSHSPSPPGRVVTILASSLSGFSPQFCPEASLAHCGIGVRYHYKASWRLLSCFPCAVLSCTLNLKDCSSLGSSVHWILQARILEWVAMPPSRGSSQPRDQTQNSHIAGGFFTIWVTREAQEYWSGKPIPSPGELPISGIEPGSPVLQANSLSAELLWKPPSDAGWSSDITLVYLFFKIFIFLFGCTGS